MEQTVIAAIAAQIERMQWIEQDPRHFKYAANRQDVRRRIAHYEREHLPSGSGYDRGCTVLMEKSTPNRIVILCPFHHMDEHGYYDGWADYTVTVTTTFTGDGMHIHVTGGRKNHRDMIAEQVGDALAQPVTEPQ